MPRMPSVKRAFESSHKQNLREFKNLRKLLAVLVHRVSVVANRGPFPRMPIISEGNSLRSIRGVGFRDCREWSIFIRGIGFHGQNGQKIYSPRMPRPPFAHGRAGTEVIEIFCTPRI